MTILSLVLFCVTIIALGVFLIKRRYRYWKDRGLPYLEPSFLKGNLGNVLKTEHIFELTKRLYFEFKKKGCEMPFGGIFVTIKPSIIVLDLDLVKKVAVKEFHNFHDRGFYLNERDDPIDANLLNVKGEPWKNLRHKLTPTFTSSKMKLMIPTMVDISKKFVKRLGEDLKNGNNLDLSDYFFRFTIDIIGSCAFGIDCNSLNDRNSEFLRMGKRIFNQSKGRLVKLIFVTMFRELAYKLRMTWTLKDVADFYSQLVTDMVIHREERNIQKNDFLNLLIQLKNKGKTLK